VITHRYEHGIHAVDAEYVQPLFDAVHLVVENGRAAFVDCGTAHSVPRLLEALEEIAVPREAVDWLFLTHVHLDHAGGAGQGAKPCR
jgi:glyoxylase-like metal-dependent hydrolase (beta-lactamase superfamily II)